MKRMFSGNEFENRAPILGLEQQQTQEIIQRAQEVLDFLCASSSVVHEPNLLTLEGIDGSGKTTLALSLATKLLKTRNKVLILRGSGTTGMEDILNWTNYAYRHDKNKSTIISDLEKVHNLQLEYQKELDPVKKMQIAVKMQVLMFALQQKYLKEGYYVISDRGILSACLGGRDRVNDLSQFYQLVSFFPYLPFGSTIFVDLPVSEAAKRGEKKGEKPDFSDLSAKACSYASVQDNLYKLVARFPDLSLKQFTIVDGNQPQRKMLASAEIFTKTLNY